MQLWLVVSDGSGELQEPGSVLLALGSCAGLTEAVLLGPPLPAAGPAPVFGHSLSSSACTTLLEIQHSSAGCIINVIALTVLQAE